MGIVGRNYKILPTVAECLDRVVAKIEVARPNNGRVIAGPEIPCAAVPAFVLPKSGNARRSIHGFLPFSRKGLNDEITQPKGEYVKLRPTKHSYLRLVVAARKDSILQELPLEAGKPDLDAVRNLQRRGKPMSNGRAEKRL